MRKILLTALIFILAACNDGNFEVDNFDFSNSTTQSCNQNTNNFFIYRISGNEALIIKIPENTFTYTVTPQASPLFLNPISIENNNIDVIYRLYNGPVATSTLCTFLPPISPNAIEEWTATSGNINIITSVSITNNSGIGSPNATRVGGFNHEIEFRNITFLKPNGNEQFYDVLQFGSFQNSSLQSLENFTGLLFQCNENNTVTLYKNSNNQVISLEVPTSLFPNETTPINEPRIAFFDTENQFNYLVFDQNLAQPELFCTNDFNLTENWLAQNGNQTLQTGIIEVTTVQSSEGFEHTVVLKKAIMERGNISFTFGDSYTLGTFILN